MSANILLIAGLSAIVLALDIAVVIVALRSDEREAERRNYETKKEVAA